MQHRTIDKADRRARRLALALVGVALLLGGVLVFAFGDEQGAIQGWIATQLDQPGGIGATLMAVMVVAVLPVVVAGIYLIVWSGRSAREARFPPLGSAVLRDTRVFEGDAARRRARLLQVLAAILIAAALMLPLALWWVVRSLS